MRPDLHTTLHLIRSFRALKQQRDDNVVAGKNMALPDHNQGGTWLLYRDFDRPVEVKFLFFPAPRGTQKRSRKATAPQAMPNTALLTTLQHVAKAT